MYLKNKGKTCLECDNSAESKLLCTTHYNEKIWNEDKQNQKIYHNNYYATHPEYRKKLANRRRQYRKENPQAQLNANKYQRGWNKENPRCNRSFSIELQLSMNNVRKRDNNTCQWQNCNLTHREAPIHVHHIFLRSEHPELELLEQYMICYCANHHGLWHRYRGDKVANMLIGIDLWVELNVGPGGKNGNIK